MFHEILAIHTYLGELTVESSSAFSYVASKAPACLLAKSKPKFLWRHDRRFVKSELLLEFFEKSAMEGIAEPDSFRDIPDPVWFLYEVFGQDLPRLSVTCPGICCQSHTTNHTPPSRSNKQIISRHHIIWKTEQNAQMQRISVHKPR